MKMRSVVWQGVPALVLSLMFSWGCEGSGQEEARGSSAQATANAPVLEAVEAADEREAPDVPGASRVPRFSASSSKTLHWSWRYDVRYPEQGEAQDRVRLASRLDGEVSRCGFSNKFHRVACDGSPGWSVELEPEPFVGAGAMSAYEGVLYVAHHDAISSGARLSAYELLTGEALWSTPLEALGDVEHSKYRNEVQIAIDQSAGVVILYGKESSGGYIETRHMEDGSLASHDTLSSSLTSPGDLTRAFPRLLSPQPLLSQSSASAIVCAFSPSGSTCADVLPGKIHTLMRERLEGSGSPGARVERSVMEREKGEISQGVELFLLEGNQAHHVYLHDVATGQVTEHIVRR